MSQKFDTEAAANQAGYVAAKSYRAQENYRNFIIVSRDISGANSYGYKYGLFVRLAGGCGIEDASGDLSEFDELCLGKSTTVKLTAEQNAMRERGAFMEMYAPETIDQAVRDARAAIDTWAVQNA
ncbi:MULTISPECIES: hypothetical protein [Ralstonia solanacearum species complex]|uniref:hypothetical protein n=1 Tax=Ralstonia solanacearum species complex TaxID=3116862 RepID=UPI0018D14990|nr:MULTISPECIES: hypothetical protein [Ralstonia solanacearum species complex]MDN3368277.1 hypothetical protein [Ralstonia pseudosolanacearum]